uniref:DCache_2 domain-containing protein n=1 Tax=Steinernema glaseri TaxID=37863 RepID=A0A1I7YCT3_9BILA
MRFRVMVLGILCALVVIFFGTVAALPLPGEEEAVGDVEQQSPKEQICRMRKCEKWDVVVMLLLKRGFRQFKFVRSLLRRAFEDCKWFNGDVAIQFLTKNFTIVDVSDYTMKLQLPSQVREGSQYDPEERVTIFHEGVFAAVDLMSPSTAQKGSYILVITDFQKNAAGQKVLGTWLNSTTVDDKVEDQELQKLLVKKAIQLRVIQLTLDGDTKTSFKPQDLISSHRVANVGDFVGKVQVFEAKNVMDHFKPCPPLSQNEQLTQTRTANHYRTQLWIERNIGATLIGGFLLLVAFLSVLLAYHYHRNEKTHVKKSSKQQLSIMNTWIKLLSRVLGATSGHREGAITTVLPMVTNGHPLAS